MSKLPENNTILHTSGLQNAIILSLLFKIFLSNYDVRIPSDRRKPINILRGKIRKFTISRQTKNQKDYDVAEKIVLLIWEDIKQYFLVENTTIEIVTTVSALYPLYEEPMTKYANIRDKDILRFANNSINLVEFSHEKNSFDAVDFILKKMSVFTGVKPLSLFDRFARDGK